MPLSTGDIIAVLSLLLTSGVGAYLAIYTRRANRALTEAQAAKTVTEARRVKAEAADVLIDASGDVVRQLREQMHQLEVNAAYDRERIDDLQEKLAAALAEKAYDREQIDDLQRKSAELRLNLERAVEELAAAQLEIRCLVAEKDSQAKQIHTLETTVRGLTNENLVLRDRLAKYEQKGGDCD